MLKAAELRALSTVDARCVGLKPERLRVPGNQILLPIEVRHPERMDDVLRLEQEENRLTDGNVHFIRRGDAPVRRRVGVVDAPPPLMPGDFDRDRLSLGNW